MRTIVAIFVYLALTGCVSANRYGSVRIVDSPSGGKVSAATIRQAERACAHITELMRIESNLYGPYGDWGQLRASMRSCMLRNGVRISYRQPDGRRTAWEFPNSLDVK